MLYTQSLTALKLRPRFVQHCKILLMVMINHCTGLILLIMLAGKSFSVLGFGSSSYPRFCAAAELMHTTMLSLGAQALMPVSKADALAGEEGVVWPWVKILCEKMQAQGWLDSAAAASLIQHLPMSDTDAVSTGPQKQTVYKCQLQQLAHALRAASI